MERFCETLTSNSELSVFCRVFLCSMCPVLSTIRAVAAVATIILAEFHLPGAQHIASA
jgi:hypothetical protein